MTPEEHRFRDQIFVPLQELTEALTEPYHRNRDWSRLHADALALAVSISHIPEAIVARTDGWNWLAERRNAENQCPGYQVIRDFGDTAKHQELNNENRIGSLTTESFFEEKRGSGLAMPHMLHCNT